MMKNMVLCESGLSATNKRISIEPQFDWHELRLCANFVRYTRREATSPQGYMYEGKKHIARVTIYSAGRPIARTENPRTMMRVVVPYPWRLTAVLPFPDGMTPASTPHEENKP